MVYCVFLGRNHPLSTVEEEVWGGLLIQSCHKSKCISHMFNLSIVSFSSQLPYASHVGVNLGQKKKKTNISCKQNSFSLYKFVVFGK